MIKGIFVNITVPTVNQRYSHQNSSFTPSTVFEIVKDESNKMNKNNRQKRTGSTRPQQRGRSNIIEGVYNNVHFMHSIASQIGNVVQVQTKSGSIFEGIFFTVSPQFDIVLQIVHRLEATANLSKSLSLSPLSSTLTGTPSNTPNSSSNSSGNSTFSSLEDQSISADSIFDVLIFKASDVVFIKAKDADLDYATKDTFQTDTAISKCNGGRYEEKELEPWQFDGDNSSVNGDVDISLELDNNSNGWDVNDMFSLNEARYGVQSTFDQSLTGYTIQIQKKDTQDFKDAEEQAEKIALEIENQPAYKERTDLENGDENEEAKFAAVERPESSSPDENKVGKYVAPGRRKHNTQAGKLIKPAQLSSNNSSNNNDVQQQSSNKYQSLVSHSLPPSQQQKNSPSAAGQQPPLIHRLHQPQIQQVALSHKMNGEDQLGSEMKHNHHRRHRSDIDSDRDRDRDRGDMITRDRENRDPRDRDSRDPRDRDGRDNRDLRDKVGPPMSQRGMRHYQPTVNQQIQQSGNANAFSEGVNNNNNNNSNNQMMVTSPMNHLTQSHQGPPQMRMFHNASAMNQDNSQHVIVPSHIVIHQQQIGPPPQPQRPRIRDEQIAEFRKFKQNFNLTSSKNPRDGNQPQQQVPIEMRSTMDESGSKSNYQSQIKPYANQVKQYSNQSNEIGSNASSIPASNVETEKRSIPTMQQQQIKSITAITNSNQNVNPTPETKVETYVSVVQQTPNQQPIQQSQKVSGSSQAINSVQSQHQQSPSPADTQQMISKERENERSTQSTSEQQQEYQSVPTQTQHIVSTNNASGTGNSPPIMSASQTSNNIGPEANSTEKAANAPKKFVLNPAAKPFTPRIPVTPNSSRPHTPQTPGTQLTPTLNSNGSSGSFTPQSSQIHAVAPPGPIPPQQPTPQPSAIPGQHVPQPQVMMTYFMPPQQSYPGAPHTQPARFRKGQIPQMQVATAASAVTGAPLHVTTPMALPQFISPYSQAHPTQPYQPYQQVRMYHEAPQPQQIQYLTSTTPSTTPSPGQPQPHQQQYHQGPQVSTAQYAQTAPQQVQMIPLFNAPPVVATPYMQPPNAGPFLVMQQHPPQ